MKKILLSTATIAIVTILLFACRKNDTIEDNKPEDLFDNLVAAQKSQLQFFEIDNAVGGTITGTGGCKITFPPNSWPPSNAKVIVRLQESLKKSQWMMDGLSATAQSDILLSGGMINLTASNKATGEALDFVPAMKVPNANLASVVRAEVPRPAGAVNVDMNLFVPVPDSSTAGPASAAKPAVLSWTPATAQFPFANSGSSYIFQLPKMQWANCDRFYGQPGAKTTIKVTPNMTAFAGASDIQVLLVYRSINCVINLPAKIDFFQSYINSIPVGSVADVVLLGKSASGKILFKVLPANAFTALQSIVITPEEVPGATVTAYLNSVN
jgi:hypothetical protein